jgi:hypothetical protein
MLKNYFPTYIIYDDKDLIPDKESPIDFGEKVFEKLYSQKVEINDTVLKQFREWM